MYNDLLVLDQRENERIRSTFNLIASENFPPRNVRKAVASTFQMKYSEGYPGNRYYAGCSIVDEMETKCKELWQKVFKTDYAVNVQVPSGSQANQAVYFSVLNPGDTILSMDLSCGGHLSHSMKNNFVGKFYNVVTYGVDRRELLDYNKIEKLAREVKPKLIIAGSSSYSRRIEYTKFSFIAKSVGAYLLADISHPAGLIVKNAYPSPFGLADFITTTTQKTLRGPRSALIFCKPEYEERLNRAVFPGIIGGCQQNMVFAKAVTADWILWDKVFGKYARSTRSTAEMMARSFKRNGFRIVSGGTDCHMFVLDVADIGLSGRQVQDNLESINICTNMNVIPYDKRSPSDPSGIRIGTAFMNSRGCTPHDFNVVAHMIMEALIEMRDGRFVCGDKKYIEKIDQITNKLHKMKYGK